MQGQPDGYSARYIFEGSCTEEGMGEGKDIFEGGLKFAASEARKYFDSNASEVQREEERSSYPSTQEHQKLEGKLKYDLAGELSGNDWGVIGERIQVENM